MLIHVATPPLLLVLVLLVTATPVTLESKPKDLDPLLPIVNVTTGQNVTVTKSPKIIKMGPLSNNRLTRLKEEDKLFWVFEAHSREVQYFCIL